MEYEEAKKIIGRFKEAITTLEWEASACKHTIERVKKLEETNKELKNEIQDLKRFERYYNLLNDAQSIQICHQCDAFGGGYIGSSYSEGGDWVQCDCCDGTGIVEKICT